MSSLECSPLGWRSRQTVRVSTRSCNKQDGVKRQRRKGKREEEREGGGRDDLIAVLACVLLLCLAFVFLISPLSLALGSWPFTAHSGKALSGHQSYGTFQPKSSLRKTGSTGSCSAYQSVRESPSGCRRSRSSQQARKHSYFWCSISLGHCLFCIVGCRCVAASPRGLASRRVGGAALAIIVVFQPIGQRGFHDMELASRTRTSTSIGVAVVVRAVGVADETPKSARARPT